VVLEKPEHAEPVKTVGNVRSSVLEESNVPNVEGSKYNAFIDNITEPKSGFQLKCECTIQLNRVYGN
jgi:hypothetical protein